jgi:hypothetical protein
MNKISSYALTSVLLASVYSSPVQAQNSPSKLDQLNGSWQGTYICPQGLTGLRLVVEAKSENEVYAMFNFFPHPTNPSVPPGSFRMKGSYTSFASSQIPDVLKLSATSWIKQPPGYRTVDLEGNVDLTQGKLDGRILDPGCDVVNLTKVKVIQAPNPNSSVIGRWSGSMTQNTAPTQWNLQLNITQNRRGDSFLGESSKQPLTPGTKASVSHEIKGDLANNVFNFREVKIIKRDAPSSWYFCDIQGQLRISSENGSDTLQGPWECLYKGQRYYGEIRLTR